jgi:hypothetical protein
MKRTLMLFSIVTLFLAFAGMSFADTYVNIALNEPETYTINGSDYVFELVGANPGHCTDYVAAFIDLVVNGESLRIYEGAEDYNTVLGGVNFTIEDTFIVDIPAPAAELVINVSGTRFVLQHNQSQQVQIGNNVSEFEIVAFLESRCDAYNESQESVILSIDNEWHTLMEGDLKVYDLDLVILSQSIDITHNPWNATAAFYVGVIHNVVVGPVENSTLFLEINNPVSYLIGEISYEFEIIGGNSEENTIVLLVNGIQETMHEGEMHNFGGIMVTVDNLFITNIPTLDASASISFGQDLAENSTIELLHEVPKIGYLYNNWYEFEIVDYLDEIKMFKEIDISVNGDEETIYLGEEERFDDIIVRFEDMNGFGGEYQFFIVVEKYFRRVPSNVYFAVPDVNDFSDSGIFADISSEMSEQNYDAIPAVQDFSGINIDSLNESVVLALKNGEAVLVVGTNVNDDHEDFAHRFEHILDDANINYRLRDEEDIDNDLNELFPSVATLENGTLFLQLNEQVTIVINGETYEFEIVGANSEDASVMLEVNGYRETIQEDEMRTFGGMIVTVDNLFVTNIPTLDASATISLGQNLAENNEMEMMLGVLKIGHINGVWYDFEITDYNNETFDIELSVNGDDEKYGFYDGERIDDIFITLVDVDIVNDVPYFFITVEEHASYLPSNVYFAVFDTNDYSDSLVFSDVYSEMADKNYDVVPATRSFATMPIGPLDESVVLAVKNGVVVLLVGTNVDDEHEDFAEDLEDILHDAKINYRLSDEGYVNNNLNDLFFQIDDTITRPLQLTEGWNLIPFGVGIEIHGPSSEDIIEAAYIWDANEGIYYDLFKQGSDSNELFEDLIRENGWTAAWYYLNDDVELTLEIDLAEVQEFLEEDAEPEFQEGWNFYVIMPHLSEEYAGEFLNIGTSHDDDRDYIRDNKVYAWSGDNWETGDYYGDIRNDDLVASGIIGMPFLAYYMEDFDAMWRPSMERTIPEFPQS